jgi:hypothetical protein
MEEGKSFGKKEYYAYDKNDRLVMTGTLTGRRPTAITTQRTARRNLLIQKGRSGICLRCYGPPRPGQE